MNTGQLPQGSFLPGRILAVPSWVFPGTLAENCRFLAGRVDEVGLLFLQAFPPAGAEEDPPADVPRLPLRYHLHLPLDLPWEDPAGAARVCRLLREKTSVFGPLRAVLHPPPHGPDEERSLASFLDGLAAGGEDPRLLLLENTPDNDLGSLVALVREYGLRVCMDMGHILAWGQEDLVRRDDLLERTDLLHLSAPGAAGDGHLPLTALDARGVALARRLLRAAPREAVIMLELFQWSGVEESLPLLRQWLESSGSP
ncbi:MAG: hypothetical protein LBO77_08250 [Desulfovibrio sp.]|jgi:hypothetical protein|nr:hypothetical protein [Desulfovibrio sp.]